jgi:HK97 family phage major capsid protein
MSKIKMQYADITGDEARARGYTKGNRKLEEVFGLLRRETQPCTIYKKQKMDRDDIIDITDFDVVAWIKSEMRLKLDEEIARAILFGDGRSTLSQDKIKEDCIRPIVKEDPLFCITKTVAAGADDDATAKNIIRAAIKAQDDYRGTGQPIMFMKQSLLSDMLLLEDADGHDLYPSKDKLTTKMLVQRIVTIPTEVWPDDIYCIIVNLADYTVGADKGGSINMFEDFDIDYNQEKYLMETRCSGSLTKPYSAVVLKKAN